MSNLKFGKQKKGILSGKSFYIALAISLVAIAIATAYAVNKTIGDIENNTKIDIGSAVPNDWGFSPLEDVENKQEGVKKESSASSGSSSSAPSSQAAKAQSESSKSAKPSPTQYSAPLTGEIVSPYSNYEMAYNKTLKVWETHNGVDIGAPLGENVKACANGVVKEVTNDELWGVGVIIEHADGLQSHYQGLGKTVVVKVGQEVKNGDVLGVVGNTATCESLEKTHLHFAIKNKDSWVDPYTLIKVKK